MHREDVVELSVSDDGAGFDPQATGEGFGLVGMRERVALAGGRLEITSAPGEGATLTARLPLGTAQTIPGGQTPNATLSPTINAPPAVAPASPAFRPDRVSAFGSSSSTTSESMAPAANAKETGNNPSTFSTSK